jgi:hypothetical protein
MNNHDRQAGIGAFFGALGAALQWRLLLLWLVVMALPTAIVALPLWKTLSGLLDHSVHATALAHTFDTLPMSDVIAQVGRHGDWLAGSNLGAIIVTLLASPFLTGMVVTAARAPRSLMFGELMHGGLSEYWRLLRLLLWALLPFGVAFAISGAASGMADKHAAAAVLESSAASGSRIATIVTVVLLVLAHAMVESGRAQLVADPMLRSATRAFFRGVGMLFRRPLATLGMYLGVSVIGYAIVLGLGMLRIRTDAVGLFGFIAALVVAQLIVAALAWQRTARLFALGAVASATPARRRAASPALAAA